jgi:hypothetical protein
MSGDHNLTVKTMARVLAACGYEVRFGIEQIHGNWLTREQPAVVVDAKQIPCADVTEEAALAA